MPALAITPNQARVLTAFGESAPEARLHELAVAARLTMTDVALAAAGLAAKQLVRRVPDSDFPETLLLTGQGERIRRSLASQQSPWAVKRAIGKGTSSDDWEGVRILPGEDEVEAETDDAQAIDRALEEKIRGLKR